MLRIKEHKYRVTCDINRCSNRNTVTIGEEGGSIGTQFVCCENHLKEIIEKGIEYFTLKGDSMDFMGGLDKLTLISKDTLKQAEINRQTLFLDDGINNTKDVKTEELKPKTPGPEKVISEKPKQQRGVSRIPPKRGGKRK